MTTQQKLRTTIIAIGLFSAAGCSTIVSVAGDVAVAAVKTTARVAIVAAEASAEATIATTKASVKVGTAVVEAVADEMTD